MINSPLMKFPLRLAASLLLALLFSSCQTWYGLQNSMPVRFFDELGAEAMRMISENDGPSQSLDALQARGQKVQKQGVYAGQLPVVVSPRQGMAAR